MGTNFYLYPKEPKKTIQSQAIHIGKRYCGIETGRRSEPLYNMGFTWHIDPNTLTDFQKDYIILTEGDEEISWNDFYTCIDNCTYDTSLIGKYFS